MRKVFLVACKEKFDFLCVIFFLTENFSMFKVQTNHELGGLIQCIREVHSIAQDASAVCGYRVQHYAIYIHFQLANNILTCVCRECR